MTEQLLPRFAGDNHAQLRRMGPIQLQTRTRLPRLREKYFPRWPVPPAPAEYPALERPERPLRLRRLALRQQMLEERLRLQLRRVDQQPFSRRPDCRQGIRPSPSPFLLRLRPVACQKVFGRCFPVHPRFHRRRAQHAGLRIFFHQSLVLLLGYHGPAWAPSLTNVRPTTL